MARLLCQYSTAITGVSLLVDDALPDCQTPGETLWGRRSGPESGGGEGAAATLVFVLSSGLRSSPRRSRKSGFIGGSILNIANWPNPAHSSDGDQRTRFIEETGMGPPFCCTGRLRKALENRIIFNLDSSKYDPGAGQRNEKEAPQDRFGICYPLSASASYGARGFAILTTFL